MSLANKVVVVSGGSGTVGSGIVAAFLDAGATVVAPVRSERAKTSLLEELGSTPTTLDIVNADVGVEEGAAALAAHLTSAYNGKVNHVVSSCGAWWQGGTLSTVPLDEFNAQLANLITGHFLLYKHLIGLVTDEPSSSFTFITGAAGQYCFLPAASMVTVGAAGAFGVALAAMAEQKSASRRVVEVRISALIRRDKADNNNNFGTMPSFSNRLIGAQLIKVATGEGIKGTLQVSAETLSGS